jgi:hypothetical protein
MHADGHVLYVSANLKVSPERGERRSMATPSRRRGGAMNGAWLTERVPPEYLGFPA